MKMKKRGEMIFLFLICLKLSSQQTIKELEPIFIDEELPVGSLVISISEKIKEIEDSSEIDLINPFPWENSDLFSLDDNRRNVLVKKRLDFEVLCSNRSSNCSFPLNLVVSSRSSIEVFVVPIVLKNVNDNKPRFSTKQFSVELEENPSEKLIVLPLASELDGDELIYSVRFASGNEIWPFFVFDAEKNSLRQRRKLEKNVSLIFSAREKNDARRFDSMEISVWFRQRARCPWSNESIFSIRKFGVASRYSFFASNKENLSILAPFDESFRLDESTGEIEFDGRPDFPFDQTTLKMRSFSLCEIQIDFPSKIEFRNFSFPILTSKNRLKNCSDFVFQNENDGKIYLNFSHRIFHRAEPRKISFFVETFRKFFFEFFFEPKNFLLPQRKIFHVEQKKIFDEFHRDFRFELETNDFLRFDPENRTVEFRQTFQQNFADFRFRIYSKTNPTVQSEIDVRFFNTTNRFAPEIKEFPTIIDQDEFLQIEATDPDLPFENQHFSSFPIVQFRLESIFDLQIDPFSGRINLPEIAEFNFSLIVTDFGFPRSLTTRKQFFIQRRTAKNSFYDLFLISTLSALVFIFVAFFIIIFLSKNLRRNRRRNQNKKFHVDTSFIDHEYVTSGNSLPRLINREQRVHPKLDHSSSSNNVVDKHLSIDDINKYLERFERIYNKSSDSNIVNSVGSVV